MRNTVQLIAYVDRFGGDIRGLTSLLNDELSGLFGGVHLLPYFSPFDGADAGFDPADHTMVDERLGDWNAIGELSKQTCVMSDLIVNHVSDSSEQFREVMRDGAKSEFWEFFLKRNDVFANESSAAGISKVYRPRPGSPFTALALDDGTVHDFWTTFSPRQLDINIESKAGRSYLESILDRLANFGVQGIRLDAIGYAIKRCGTDCFMLPETFELIESLRLSAAKRGMEVLVEIHSHYQTQIDIAERVSWVYDFALPPLILHTLFKADAAALKKWLRVSPRNCITVLDTHDGIGIVDVARDGARAGLLSDSEIEALVEQIGIRTDGQSRLASGRAASNLDIYQINSTYYDALGHSDRLYLIARAMQFFAPGIPQIYYMGLLAERNDMALLEKTGIGRDINRHYFGATEISAALARPVVQALFALIRLRNSAIGFQGEFDMPECEDDRLKLRWQLGENSIELDVELKASSGVITRCENGVITQYIVTDTFGQLAASGEQGSKYE